MLAALQLICAGAAVGAQASVTRQQAEYLLVSLLKAPTTPEFASSHVTVLEETDSSVAFWLPDERLQPGLVGHAAGGRASISKAGGYVESFVVTTQYDFPPDTRIPVADTRQVAERFARRHFAFVWKDATTVDELPCEAPNHLGWYYFRWTKWLGKTRTRTFAFVNVRCWDGKIISFGAHDSDPIARVPPVVSREQAIQTATKQCRRAAGEQALCRLIDSHLEVWPNPDRLVYRVRFLTQERADGRTGYETLVDAQTGEVIEGDDMFIQLQPPPNDQTPDPYRPQTGTAAPLDEDRWPSLVGSRLLYVSRRTRIGFPTWQRPSQGIFLTNPGDRSTSYVLAGPDVDYSFPALTANGQLLVAQAPGQTVVTWDLRTGRETQHTTETRPGMGPFGLSADGGTMAFTAVRGSGRSGSDVFLIDILTSLKRPQGQRRLARIPGEDRMPVFRPGSSALAFAHRAEDGEGQTQWQVVAFPLDPAAEPDDLVVLAEDLEALGRITWFPDGERLLVWDGSEVCILNATTGSTTPLPLADLRDPDGEQQGRLLVLEPTLDDTGEWLVFAGKTESDGAEPRGTRIYRCRLDGTQVQRLSPLTDDPIPPYVFPASGRSALEVAKERTRELHEKRAQGPPSFPVEGWEQRNEDG